MLTDELIEKLKFAEGKVPRMRAVVVLTHMDHMAEITVNIQGLDIIELYDKDEMRTEKMAGLRCVFEDGELDGIEGEPSTQLIRLSCYSCGAEALMRGAWIEQGCLPKCGKCVKPMVPLHPEYH